LHVQYRFGTVTVSRDYHGIKKKIKIKMKMYFT
jgi:hypothetical protein